MIKVGKNQGNNVNENILVFTAEVARKLIKQGYSIIDIKPAKENKDKTIFVFKREKDIEKLIKEYSVRKKYLENNK